MEKFLGEKQLKAHADEVFTRRIDKINDKVYFFAGYGGANMILFIGDDSCVLVDSLNGKAPAIDAMEEIKKITDKPINTIIYTHSHGDHTSGAGVFANENTEIFAHKNVKTIYGHSNLLVDVNKKRGMSQLGGLLTPEENICVGVGIAVGPLNNPFLEKAYLPPTTVFDDEVLKINRSGIDFELVNAPGETDDQIFVWVPEFKILCCADNYYESFPNLYAIRGSQYRDVSLWVDALTKMIAYPTEILLPGHTRIVNGADVVKETLTNYRDAIEWVLLETLKGMNEGLRINQLVDKVVLPEKWAKLPYLQEYYGGVEWSVRAIFNGYLGWYDGNPTNLRHLEVKEKADKTIALMGGSDKVLAEIKKVLANGEYQWAMELCDILIDAKDYAKESIALKLEAMENMARTQISANARHYYLTASNMIKKNILNKAK